MAETMAEGMRGKTQKKKKKIKAPVCVVIPTLNEEDAIAGVVSSIPSRVLGKRVAKIVVDGHSTDATVARARKAGAFVFVQSKHGKGAAIQEAVEKIDCDVLVLIDGDGSYDAASLEKIVAPILRGKADMVVATRGQRKSGAIKPFNAAGNALFNFVISFVYGKRITDMLSGYRAISMRKLREMILVSKSFEIETELTIEALRHELRVLEKPLLYDVRVGRTKLNPVRDGLRILKVLLLLTRDTKPLYFFGVLSFVFLLFSLWPLSLVIGEKLALGHVEHLPSVVLASFLLLLAVQTFVFGLLADMTLSQNRRMELLLKRNGKR
jgi:dolichol-phosphate mannosyltransferase